MKLFYTLSKPKLMLNFNNDILIFSRSIEIAIIYVIFDQVGDDITNISLL